MNSMMRGPEGYCTTALHFVLFKQFTLFHVSILNKDINTSELMMLNMIELKYNIIKDINIYKLELAYIMLLFHEVIIFKNLFLLY